jgi:predicted transcriptional regulator
MCADRSPQALLLNTRIMYYMSTAKGDPERAVEGFISVAHLLDEPRLARLYASVLRHEHVTIDEIVDEVGMPRTTVYSDAASLVDLGVLTRDETQKTHTYTAIPVVLTTTLDEDEYTITPTLIEAIGRIPRDQDLSLLTEKHGIGKLAAALTYAIPYVEGGMSERVAARELDLQPAFGIAVLHALREVILDMQDHDPYFERIRSARESPLDEGR